MKLTAIFKNAFKHSINETSSITEKRYLDKVEIGSILDKKLYVTEITDDTVIAYTFYPAELKYMDHYEFVFSDSNETDTIVLNQRVELPKRKLDMDVGLDLRHVEAAEYYGISDTISKEEYEEKKKKVDGDEKRENRPMTKREYEKEVRDFMASAREDGNEEHTYDLAQNFVMNSRIEKYAKKKYGQDWEERVQWDLENEL